MSGSNPSIFRLPIPKGAGPFRPLLRAGAGLVERALGLRGLERVHQGAQGAGDSFDFVARSLEFLDTGFEVPTEELARIPSQGPVVIVANHPHGMLDGLLVTDLVGRVRRDFQFLANHLLRRIPEMADLVIPMDPFGGPEAAGQNRQALRTAKRKLENGGCIVLFPAGIVAHERGPGGKVLDAPWRRTVATLVRRTGAQVVPLYIDGKNSRWFQMVGKIHADLRTALLPRELLRKRHSVTRMRVGHPIPASRLDRFQADRELTDYLRLRCELLGRRPTGAGRLRRSLTDLLRRRRVARAEALEPIEAAQPTEVIEAEIAGLPAEARLVEAGRFDVFIARAPAIPRVLQEIARLREVTFRQVGEGTGKATDRDEFDDTYLHLWVWDKEARTIAGAYRLGESDRLLEKGDLDALYTATLFSFDQRFVDAVTPGLEMGRSFVAPAYQRNYLPLLLLWRGIGAYVVKNPRYKLLFGPVSISAEYEALSQGLMLGHLKAHRFEPELATRVAPRNPVGDANSDRFGLFWSDVMLGDLDEVSRMVSDVERDEKGVPVLVREYLKLGGRFVAFNRDPLFSDVVDGLVLVDLTQTPAKLLRRYMGDEASQTFLAHHAGVAATPAG